RPPIKRLPPLVKMRPQPTAGIRPFEVFPKEDRPPVVPLPKPKPPAEALPKVAIIIDDLGYDQRIAQKFLDLDAGLTFAVLPLAPHTRLIAATIFKKGGELMLHLPMEPLEYPSVDPGPGALLSSMSADDLIAQLRENLSDVPGIKGVNNHMGSKLTAESARLYQVFSVLKKEGLFFIDSRSTAETVGRPSARLFQLPFAERDVFIDHVQDPDLIRLRVKELIQIARKNGEAIGIAHPSKTTLRILEEMLPMLKKEVQLVPASHVVHVIS
ncbi:MAG: divergent polysaccharide deacetylase family protein, partial [Desulfobacterales bacterium]